MKSWKRIFGEAYMLFKIRSGRGGTFTAEIDGLVNAFNRGGIIIILINTYFHWLPPIWIIPLIWLLQKGTEYLLGWYDQNHLHWQQFETDYTARNLNPWNVELLNRVKNIENEIKHTNNKT